MTWLPTFLINFVHMFHDSYIHLKSNETTKVILVSGFNPSGLFGYKEISFKINVWMVIIPWSLILSFATWFAMRRLRWNQRYYGSRSYIVAMIYSTQNPYRQSASSQSQYRSWKCKSLKIHEQIKVAFLQMIWNKDAVFTTDCIMSFNCTWLLTEFV